MCTDEVWGLSNSIWDTISNAYEEYKLAYPQLIFHRDKKHDFDKRFKERYLDVKIRFMTDNSETLDSHKQAAIITVCILELKIIECPEEENNDSLCIIPQMIAISVALSYMLECLNSLLKKKRKKQIDRYYFPVALACDTKYEKIMCRILYQEQHEEDMNFNVLELSDRYFLLEYINLLQHGIEPPLLKQND